MKRIIKIYCPAHTHQFETEENAKLVCEMTEHSLSLNFPHGEFWEYCCDCQSFFPGGLSNGETAVPKCPVCERNAKKRFLCATCKIVSFSSEQSERETAYQISDENGIAPSCPGCQTDFKKQTLSVHDCKKTNAVFVTPHEKCPFCEKSLKPKTAPSETAMAMRACPKCKAEIEADSVFCGKCGMPLEDAGHRDESFYLARTRRLDSFCPRCSAPVVPNSTFCGKCGQAVKAAGSSSAPNTPQPPPTPLSRQKTEQFNNPPPPSFQPTTTPAPQSTTAQFNVSPTNLSPGVSTATGDKKIIYGALAFGAFLLVMVLLGVVIQNSRGRGTTDGNVSTTSVKDSRIGREGYLTTNLNLRGEPNSTSYLLATHYENAKIKVLDVQTFSDSPDWYKIKVLEYGTDVKTGNGKGKNNPGASDGFGWMLGADEGWVNAKFVKLN